MIPLILTIFTLVVAFFIQNWSPLLSGFIAVIPVKIIGTGWIVFEGGGGEALRKAIEGMLIGQFIWGFGLLGAYCYLARYSTQ